MDFGYAVTERACTHAHMHTHRERDARARAHTRTHTHTHTHTNTHTHLIQIYNLLGNSYMIIGNVLLLNVVVAVLLDEFIANVEREKQAADEVPTGCRVWGAGCGCRV